MSYAHKHNEANGEDNRDGSDDNHSTNCGVEGPTDDPSILQLRQQLRRSLLACLLLGQGVPLLLAGDEVGNSQDGNNNAYCQDNPIGWVDWSKLGREGEDMCDLIGRLTELRRRFPQLRPRRFVGGRQPDGSYGVLWLTPRATEMTEQDWNFPEGRFLAYALGPLQQGKPPLYIVLNAAAADHRIRLPSRSPNAPAGPFSSIPPNRCRSFKISIAAPNGRRRPDPSWCSRGRDELPPHASGPQLTGVGRHVSAMGSGRAASRALARHIPSDGEAARRLARDRRSRMRRAGTPLQISNRWRA